MAKPNMLFELNVKDMDLIEEGLILLQRHHMGSVGSEIREVEDLKSKIFHQKNWYRPKGTYISG